jgi:hypothetical protein
MLLANQSLYVYRPPTHLLPVHPPNQRLVVHIFLAHAPSLQSFVEFSSRNFKEVFSQLLLQRVGRSSLAVARIFSSSSLAARS